MRVKEGKSQLERGARYRMVDWRLRGEQSVMCGCMFDTHASSDSVMRRRAGRSSDETSSRLYW